MVAPPRLELHQTEGRDTLTQGAAGPPDRPIEGCLLGPEHRQTPPADSGDARRPTGRASNHGQQPLMPADLACDGQPVRPATERFDWEGKVFGHFEKGWVPVSLRQRQPTASATPAD